MVQMEKMINEEDLNFKQTNNNFHFHKHQFMTRYSLSHTHTTQLSCAQMPFLRLYHICIIDFHLVIFNFNVTILKVTPLIKRRRQRLSNVSFPIMFLPDELIVEVLSFLKVKTIVQLKYLSKSWNTLISDPTFIEKHLKRSSQKTHLTLFWNQHIKGFNLVQFLVHRLLKNPSITVYSDNFHRLKSKRNCMIGCSYKGLLCLHFHFLPRTPTVIHLKEWLRFWNPATSTRSKNIGALCYSTANGADISILLSLFKFTIGYYT